MRAKSKLSTTISSMAERYLSDTSDMAARKSLYLSLQSQLVECVILLGKDLTTQSAHSVLALVVATDTAECHDFGFQMTASLCWKGELLLMVRHGCHAMN